MQRCAERAFYFVCEFVAETIATDAGQFIPLANARPKKAAREGGSNFTGYDYPALVREEGASRFEATGRGHAKTPKRRVTKS